MRQNAGRKTLGQIAVEFELWKEQFHQDRALEAKALIASQKKKVLKIAGSINKQKEKTPATPAPTNNDKNDESWDWRYTPRPCTRKDCKSQWYSPFDNKLYFLYHTSRPSGLIPLPTLCPRCAKTDVEAAEERMEGRKNEGTMWEQWCEEVRRDREMEVEFWEKAQERLVREEGVVCAASLDEKEEKGKGKKIEKKEGKDGDKVKKGAFKKIKGGCTVM